MTLAVKFKECVSLEDIAQVTSRYVSIPYGYNVRVLDTERRMYIFIMPKGEENRTIEHLKEYYGSIIELAQPSLSISRIK